MKTKDCQGCKYLYGSKNRPYCDVYDEPVGHIYKCKKRKEIKNEDSIADTHQEC